MTTRNFSARNIPAAWYKFRTLPPCAAIGLLGLASIAPLLAQKGATRLARGIERFDNGKYGEAIQELTAAQAQTPKLADYTAFYLASSRAGLKDFAQVHVDL